MNLEKNSAVIKYLSFALSIQAFGYAIQVLKGKVAWNEAFLRELGMSMFNSKVLMYLLALSFIYCAWQILKRQSERSLILLFSLIFSLSVTKFFQEQGDLTLLSRATHYLAPLALYITLKKSLLVVSPLFAFQLMRAGMAFTFIGHGLKCLMLDSSMSSILTKALLQFEVVLSPTIINIILSKVGFLDLAVGVAVLFYPRKELFLYMSSWIVIAVIARFLSQPGLQSLDEVFIRISYMLVPFVLYKFNSEVWNSESKEARLALNLSHSR